MNRRPIEITVLSVYLLIVFSLSAIGSLFGATKALAPYTATEWLILAVPKLIAILAGIALWRMLRIGAWLWFASVLLGWVLAVSLKTGFFPSLTIATIVSVVIVVASIWAIARNWSLLRLLKPDAPIDSEAAE